MLKQKRAQQKIRNIAEERIHSFNQSKVKSVENDPIVKAFREKNNPTDENGELIEVTPEVIKSMTSSIVRNKRLKKRVNEGVPLTTQEFEQIEISRPTSYNLRPNASKNTKSAIRISSFDKSFERDCL